MAVKRMLGLAFACGALAASAQLKTLESGSVIVGNGLQASSALGGGPIVYSPYFYETFKLAIDAEGTRTYVSHHGSPYWIYDRRFTRLQLRGNDVPPEERWLFLPPEGKVEPGMAWTVPVHRQPSHCGFVEAHFQARAEKGPEIPVRIDGRDTKVPTVKITHESPLRCEGREPWLRVGEIHYSPELHEILYQMTLNYDGLDRGGLLLADPGKGWTVTSITTTSP